MAGKNKIINGDFGIWQRGTGSFSTIANYTADRWNVDNSTTTRQTGTNQFPYCIQLANSTGNPAIRQGVELPVVGNAGIWQIGSTFTISFYAKTSTTVSANLAFYAAFADGAQTGLDGNAQQIVSTTNIGASSTSWTKYTTTFTIGSGVAPVSTNKCVEIVIYLNSGSYSGNFSVTGVQLEAGSVATPFTTATGTLSGELAACQRYYVRINNSSGFSYLGAVLLSRGNSQSDGYVRLPVPMRTYPTGIDFGNIFVATYAGGSNAGISTLTLDVNCYSNINPGINVTAVSSLGSAGQFISLQGNNSSVGYIGFSAEL